MNRTDYLHLLVQQNGTFGCLTVKGREEMSADLCEESLLIASKEWTKIGGWT
jgi:hypothetical protein